MGKTGSVWHGGKGGGGGKEYKPFTGASSYEDGTDGLVPAPKAGFQECFLSGSGLWESIIKIKEYTESAWDVAPGKGVYDMQLPGYGLYMLMVRGITQDSALSYLATFYVAHRDVSPVGSVSYGGSGNLVFTAVPEQVMWGTSLDLARGDQTRFIFGINNMTEDHIDVLYSYLRIL